jgi:biopolymer transport protein ExbD
MNLKQAIGKSRRSEEAEINITPVMNIFVILIPFLLLTATFVKIAIIDLSLPTLEMSSGQTENEIKDLTVLVISINSEGFEIKTSENNYPVIKKNNGNFDYIELVTKLTEIKTQFPKLEDVIITPTSEVLYQEIVNVLDHCREIGFPNYSISG